MRKSKNYFEDIDHASLSEKIIILDIDGTLVGDGESVPSQKVYSIVRQLASVNTVYLLSNKKLPLRNKNLAEFLQIPYLETPHRKPNPKIINYLQQRKNREIIVIGDKYSTDGIFAKKIGARFIKVKHNKGDMENLKTKFTYMFDDTFGKILSFLSSLY
jgi:predicted HAD superfamily phosphohydrolase YqeG